MGATIFPDERPGPMPKITSLTPIEDTVIAPEVSEAIFDQVARFAGYGFNKSHAAAYAAIAFRTAWLKTHHPEAFFSAAMTVDMDEVTKIALHVTELKKRGLLLWAPNINLSGSEFHSLKLSNPVKSKDTAIVYGLGAIRHVGHQAARDIVAERRTGGKFRDIRDFRSRMGNMVSNRATLALAEAGAFDRIATSRSAAIGEASDRSVIDARQMSFFDFDAEIAKPAPAPAIPEHELMMREYDVLGHFLTGHPLERLHKRPTGRKLSFSGSVLDMQREAPRIAMMPAMVVKIDVRRTRAGDTMAILTLSDPDRTYEAVAYASSWDSIRRFVRTKQEHIFCMSVQSDEGDRRLIINDVEPVELDPALAA